jgi:hypothetical protein
MAMNKMGKRKKMQSVTKKKVQGEDGRRVGYGCCVTFARVRGGPSVRPAAAEPAGARRVCFDEIKDGGWGDREAGRWIERRGAGERDDEDGG